MEFQNIRYTDKSYPYMVSFTLDDTHVTYANTLRRLILTGVETIAFRSNMTSTGSTTDVYVERNDTPMTNEMLADRIGLLPLYSHSKLDMDKIVFRLNVTSDKDKTRYVKASDFRVFEKKEDGDEVELNSKSFIPQDPITKDTCLIATLPPTGNSPQQAIIIEAKASKGTGREHARFCPVSQCSYEYTLDPDPVRIKELFNNWLVTAKKISSIDENSERYKVLQREFNTMQIKRCYKMNEKGEANSFDFTIESSSYDIKYIVNRACEVGENMCSRYVNLTKNPLPEEITISSADARLVGYDFLFRGHDHTLGNLLQTWLIEHHLEGSESPKITFAGYKVPHPLRDEMVLRIGVEDGEEKTARLALSKAAQGCVKLFQDMRNAWNRSYPKDMI